MQDVKYSTANERKLNVAIQHQIGALENGWLGTDTMVLIAYQLGAKCFPLTVKMYGYPTIVSPEVLLFSPKGKSLSIYANSMLGSFTYKRGLDPCSILVENGKVVFPNSCHAHIRKPESVIYKTQYGKVGITRAISTSDLPKNTITAIGGMGLIQNYDPKAEGFTGSYADVTYKNNHNVIGYKQGLWYGIYFPSMTASAINEVVKNKFQFEYALLLDGGGLAAMNGTENFAKINTSVGQGYAVQFL